MQSFGKLCVFLFLFISFSSKGADMSDYQGIEKTINQYFNGLKNADRRNARKRFHGKRRTHERLPARI